MEHENIILEEAKTHLIETQAEIDNDFDKVLGDNGIPTDDWQLDVSEDSGTITGKVRVDNEWIPLNATINRTSTAWSIEVANRQLLVPAAAFEYNLLELEEARDRIHRIEEGDDTEEMDHPDGEDETWED